MKRIKIDPQVNVNEISNKVLSKYKDDQQFLQVNNLLTKQNVDFVDIVTIYESKRKCLGCNGLSYCKQVIKGHHLWYVQEQIVSYACSFQQDKQAYAIKYKNLIYTTLDINRNLPKLDDVDIDASRIELLEHISNLTNNQTTQGLYLYGPPGIGKTYIIEALLNYYLSNEIKCSYIILNDLFAYFKKLYFSYEADDKEQLQIMLRRLKRVSVLFIDDIGAENVDAISRDDFLFPILDYRMKNKLITIFTSNYSQANLEKHYENTSAKINEPIKAKRLLERVKVLGKEYVMNSSKSRR